MKQAPAESVEMMALGQRLHAFFRRLFRRSPRSFGEFITAGNLFLANREFDKAVAALNEAVRLEPKNPLGYRRRAAAFGAIGDILQTSLDTRKACQLESSLRPPPQNPDERVNMTPSGNWYCRAMGIELGPMSWDDLVGMARRTNLDRKDLVRQGEQGQWVAAGSVHGLFAAQAKSDQELEFDLGPRESGDNP